MRYRGGGRRIPTPASSTRHEKPIAHRGHRRVVCVRNGRSGRAVRRRPGRSCLRALGRRDSPVRQQRWRPRCSTGIAADMIGTSVHRSGPSGRSSALRWRRSRPSATKRVGDLITVRVRTGHGTWVYLEIRGAQAQSSDGDGEAPILVVARDVTRPAPPRLRPGRHGRAAGGHGEHARHGRARRRDRR